MNKNKTKRISGLAVSGFILAILGILCSWAPQASKIAYSFAAIALIFGIVGLIATVRERRVGQGFAIAAIIISILAFAVVYFTQALYGSLDKLNMPSDHVSESVKDLAETNTDELLETSVDVTLGEFVFSQGADINLTYDDTSELPVTILNKSSEKASYTVKVEALDADGVRVSEYTILVSDLEAGQSVTEKAFEDAAVARDRALESATFKVFEVSK